jgi:hypothetical protein
MGLVGVVVSPPEEVIMWTCPKCRAEVEDTFDICWQCGTDADGTEDPSFDPERDGVMDEEALAAEQEARRQGRLVTVGTFWTSVEAHLFRGRLEAAGLHALVMDELATTMSWGLLNTHGGVKVVVPEKELEEALRKAQEFMTEDRTKREKDDRPRDAGSEQIRGDRDAIQGGGGGL